MPLYNADGELFPEKLYENLRNELTVEFGGMTEYSRNPAKSFWKANKSQVEKDELLVFEVMCVKVDPEFWNALKVKLIKAFKQESIIIRSSKIELLSICKGNINYSNTI